MTLSGVLSTPVLENDLDDTARSFLTYSKRATPAPPHFVIYGDKWVPGLTGPPAASEIKVCFLYRRGADSNSHLPSV